MRPVFQSADPLENEQAAHIQISGYPEGALGPPQRQSASPAEVASTGATNVGQVRLTASFNGPRIGARVKYWVASNATEPRESRACALLPAHVCGVTG